MNTQITDCGRLEAGLKERADCTVRAVAACLSIPYIEAHARLESMGRRNRCRFRFMAATAEALGLQQRADLSCMTVAKALEGMTSGRFIVRIQRHVFAVTDGTVIDARPVPPGSHVLMVYQHSTPLTHAKAS